MSFGVWKDWCALKAGARGVITSRGFFITDSTTAGGCFSICASVCSPADVIAICSRVTFALRNTTCDGCGSCAVAAAAE